MDQARKSSRMKGESEGKRLLKAINGLEELRLKRDDYLLCDGHGRSEHALLFQHVDCFHHLVDHEVVGRGLHGVVRRQLQSVGRAGLLPQGVAAPGSERYLKKYKSR
jgi:hypothetical protein